MGYDFRSYFHSASSPHYNYQGGIMMALPAIPKAPEGVKYALTVPQSVLFADLSLQGNLRSFFKTAMQIDYEPQYVIIDNGAMSWNYDSDESFVSALRAGSSTVQAISKFISAMEATTRTLDKISRVVYPSVNRRVGTVGDLIEDLEEYWYAYKLQMTNLFTFWNVEYLLSTALTEELTASGHVDEIRKGLARFLRPYETNYYILERKQLERLARRFAVSSRKGQKLTVETVSPKLVDALRNHSEVFGFLLAPFNLGASPTAESLLERLNEIVDSQASQRKDSALVEFAGDSFSDLPPGLQELGTLAQRFTFWRSERLDILSLSDARVQSLYQEACTILKITSDQLFAMTSQEILESLRQGKPVVKEDVRRTRNSCYCLLLYNGDISFYSPSKISQQVEAREGEIGSAGTILQGVAASAGEIVGKARVITNLEDLGLLEAGDILVTTMTRPEMGTALDRAGAFVTDEGGLMSHAAIISREMGKPCVIGLGNATRVIRSGMVLHVDGSNGRVTIVKISD
jgi:phosphohistidine swiveling domain-containing protein